MTQKYQIDLKEVDDRHKEAEINIFINKLLQLIKDSELINFEDYEIDDVRHELFGHAAKLVRRALVGCNCRVSTSLSQGGFVGTISIVGKHIVPSDHEMFVSSILASDSIEMEADLAGNIRVNLTFFDMLKKVRDGGKN